MSNGDLKIIAGQSHEGLTDAICRHLDHGRTRTKVIRFSNENLMVQIQENVRGADVFVVQTSCSPVNEGIMELLITIDALRDASAGRITAVIPYFPYVRSDKKDKPRISITARLMADLIKAAGADRVLTMDLHAPQIQGFFRIPADQLQARPILLDHIRSTGLENTVLVTGDAGGTKVVGGYASRLGLPMAIIDKRRHDDSETPKATHLIGEVEGKRCIIVDDEVASGRTLIEAATFLLEQHGAASVEAAFTHPVFTGDAVKNLDASPIARIITTDTIPTPSDLPDKFTVLSVATLFGNAIRRIHDGDSVSGLFE